MRLRPPRPTRTSTLLPSTTLFRAAAVVTTFVAVLRTLNAQIDVLEDSIAAQLDVHSDAHIVKSLPRSGMLRAARLLAELRSEEHTSELQSLMRISSAVFCLKKKKNQLIHTPSTPSTHTTTST